MRGGIKKSSSFWDILRDLDEKNQLRHKSRKKKRKERKLVLKADKIVNKKNHLTLAKEKLNCLTMLLRLIVVNNEKFSDAQIRLFQTLESKMDPNADKDSMSLLCEQGTPPRTQDEEEATVSQPSQRSERGEKEKEKTTAQWKCPKCPKVFTYEKNLTNHLEKKHQNLEDTLDESSFAPGAASSQDESLKRKRDSHEDKMDEGLGAPRIKLDTIGEEVDEKILDDTFGEDVFETPSGSQVSTQQIRNSVAENIRQAEQEMVNLDMNDEDPDASLRRDEEKRMVTLEEKLRLKDDLLHIKTSDLMEREGEISELKELLDQKTRQLKEMEQKMDEKEKEAEDLRQRIAVAERQSPAKEALKADLERADATIANLNGRMANLSKELKVAKANLRKHEVDFESFEKVRTSMQATLLKVEKVEKKCEEVEMENAKLKKKIPCRQEDCDRGNRCENSHQLRYEDRREPKDPQWRKRLPCKFYNTPNGCRNSDEKCGFIHEASGNQRARRNSEQSRSSDDDSSNPSFLNINLQKFRKFPGIKEEPEEESSVEECSPTYQVGRGPVRKLWSSGRGARRNSEAEEERPAKKIKVEQEDEDVWAGNDHGAGREPRHPVPRRLSTRSSDGGQGPSSSRGRSASRGSDNTSTSTRPKRKFSPIRSPTEERDPPRDREENVDWKVYKRAQRDLRYQVNSRRRMMGNRGRGQYRYDEQEEKFEGSRKQSWDRRSSHGRR